MLWVEWRHNLIWGGEESSINIFLKICSLLETFVQGPLNLEVVELYDPNILCKVYCYAMYFSCYALQSRAARIVAALQPGCEEMERFPTSKCITFCCKMLNTALLSRMSQKSKHTRYEEIILGRTCCEEAPQFVPACYRDTSDLNLVLHCTME